jgi:hypothetical protein
MPRARAKKRMVTRSKVSVVMKNMPKEQKGRISAIGSIIGSTLYQFAIINKGKYNVKK